MKKLSKTKHGIKARQALIQGSKEVYDAVSTTLGSRGRNIVITKHHDTEVLHDGVRIANHINPEDPFVYAGAEIVKQSAQQQVDAVGDGTTATIVLAHSIAYEALKVVESGVNPMSLRSGIEHGISDVVEEIKRQSTPIKTKKQKIQIATISSEDEHMGQLIGETLHKSGVDGVVTVEEAVGPDTFVEHQEGMQFEAGYRTEYFVTNPTNMTSTISNPKVLVTDYNLSDPYELVPLFDKLFKENNHKNFVVIAGDVEGSVLATLIQNKQKGIINCNAIKAPSYNRKSVLQDISILLGATFISKEAKMSLKDITLDDLGDAQTITSDRHSTVIIGGGGDPKVVESRVTSIKKQISEAESEFEKEKLKERLAKLTGGIFVINVGGHTEVEVREKKERAIDAVLATKAAIKQGIVPGGEVVYINSLHVLDNPSEEDEMAYRILRKALKAPFHKLVTNAGLDAGQMLEKISRQPAGHGVNVNTGEVVNLVSEGIIDPALVSIHALQNASSVAINIITSDGIVSETIEE